MPQLRLAQAPAGSRYVVLTLFESTVFHLRRRDPKISEMGLPSSDPDYWATEVLNVIYFLIHLDMPKF